MQIVLTWQSVITAAALVGAVVALVTYFAKIVHWVDKQNKQDEEIKRIKKHHEDDIKAIKEEQTLLVEGVLACLKGLQEKGCNGPVTKAIDKYEDYLNQKAHK
jgi:phosphoglycolate phosphatase-like HAD superfamily hydrolase